MLLRDPYVLHTISSSIITTLQKLVNEHKLPRVTHTHACMHTHIVYSCQLFKEVITTSSNVQSLECLGITLYCSYIL